MPSKPRLTPLEPDPPSPEERKHPDETKEIPKEKGRIKEKEKQNQKDKTRTPVKVNFKEKLSSLAERVP
jgi:hypothetical protein